MALLKPKTPLKIKKKNSISKSPDFDSTEFVGAVQNHDAHIKTILGQLSSFNIPINPHSKSFKSLSDYSVGEIGRQRAGCTSVARGRTPLATTGDLKSPDLTVVAVQVRSRAPSPYFIQSFEIQYRPVAPVFSGLAFTFCLLWSMVYLLHPKLLGVQMGVQKSNEIFAPLN